MPRGSAPQKDRPTERETQWAYCLCGLKGLQYQHEVAIFPIPPLTSEWKSPMHQDNTHSRSPLQGGFYIYGITLPDSGDSLIKVGFSKSPISRLQSFQTASPFRLKLSYVSLPMATRTEAMEAESAFHAAFAIYRVSGEWFFFPRRSMTDTIDYALDALRSDNGEMV